MFILKKIIIGSDKSGFELKENVKNHLLQLGIDVTDVGTVDIQNFQPFYVVAPKVAKRVQSGEFERGILICGTGMGMCIIANKFKGIYAAAVESEYTAEMAKILNDANILTMGGWVLTPVVAYRIIDRWFEVSFTEGIPTERITILTNAKKELQAIEDQNFR